MSPRKVVLSDAWLEKLCENQGINYHRTGRIIIDARAGFPVLMYVVQFGDDGLLEVTPPKAEPPGLTS